MSSLRETLLQKLSASEQSPEAPAPFQPLFQQAWPPSIQYEDSGYRSSKETPSGAPTAHPGI